MAGAVARRRAALLGLAAVRPLPAAAGRAHARTRSGAVRAHPACSGRSTRAPARRPSSAVMAASVSEIPYTRHPARRGFVWLRHSHAMFVQHRLAWIGLLLAYYVSLLVVDAVPWIGVFVAPVLKPVLSVGFLAAAWTQERGGKPSINMLLRGLRANLGALLPLGIVFIAGISIALGATALVDGGQLLDLLYGAPSDDAS